MYIPEFVCGVIVGCVATIVGLVIYAHNAYRR